MELQPVALSATVLIGVPFVCFVCSVVELNRPGQAPAEAAARELSLWRASALCVALVGIMKDLKNPTVIRLKGALFLALGMAAAVLLLAEVTTLKVAVLLALTVWGFCRAYYFAFYVIEHYVDPGFRFSGLLSFAAYLLRKRRRH